MLKISGKKPDSLGVKGDKLSKCSWKPNCVCSCYHDDPDHFIEPINSRKPLESTWAELITMINEDKSAKTVTQSEHYLHIEFSSSLLGFVDDVEFLAAAEDQVIHVRSASRLGVRDFGVNRKRIEAIRTHLS